MTNRISLLLALPIFLWASFAATAEEMKVSGTLVYIPVSQQAAKQPDGSMLLNIAYKGVIRADAAASPLNLMAHDCRVTVSVSADGQSQTGGGHCTGIDSDGDAWWLSFMTTAKGSEWTAMGGSGKYEGVTGEGTTTKDTEFPDGRLAEHFEGTLTLK